jgi:hypothetical protein
MEAFIAEEGGDDTALLRFDFGVWAQQDAERRATGEDAASNVVPLRA